MTRNNLLSEKLSYNGESPTPTHLHLCTYNAEGMQRYTGENIASLEPYLGQKSIDWIQIHGLQNAAVIEDICQHFGIDFLITQDILNANHQTKIEEHERYNVIILKLLSPDGENDFIPQQLSIVQGEKFLLTFTERDSDFFNEIETAIRNNVLKIRNRQSDFLLSVLLNSVMASYMSIIVSMEDDLEDIEERLISPGSGEIPGIDDIQTHRKNYRMIKKNIFPLKEEFSKLLHTENILLHKQNRPFFSDVNDHLQFIIQTLEGCREMFPALVELYLSNNDLRMNNIMKQLTVVSTIFIPLTFLVGIWGMNFRNMPELDWQYGYLYAWGLMLLTAIAVYLYIKRKKWY